MPSKTHGEAGGRDPVGEALDRLYAAPLDEFVPRRRDAVAALRAAGEVTAARVVGAAVKPSRTAWALNQVARRQPELLASALQARALAVAAQATGEGEALRTTARSYRETLAALVQAAGDAVREEGGELTAAQGRRISATVQAIAGSDDPDVRETLRAGRLATDVDVDDPFAGFEVALEEKAREPRAAASAARDDLASRRAAEAGRELERARERERAALEREQERQARELEKARARVAALEEEARQARAAAREAEVAASRAQAEAERLRRAVEAVEKRLSEARGELRSRST
jgi:hypothetical protein